MAIHKSMSSFFNTQPHVSAENEVCGRGGIAMSVGSHYLFNERQLCTVVGSVLVLPILDKFIWALSL